jgi:hypothetical protein
LRDLPTKWWQRCRNWNCDNKKWELILPKQQTNTAKCPKWVPSWEDPHGGVDNNQSFCLNLWVGCSEMGPHGGRHQTQRTLTLNLYLLFCSLSLDRLMVLFVIAFLVCQWIVRQLD